MRDRLLCLIGPLLGAALLAPLASADPRPASPSPTVRTSQACYRVGERATVTGAGFSPSRAYDIAIDGVDFGQSTTSASGGFTVGLEPGGLPAGVTQAVDSLDATDGTSAAKATFTLTRRSGALFTPSEGPPRRAGRFELWDLGAGATVYLHYVHGTARVAVRTVRLGTARGACGALRSTRRQLFPFTPADGGWTLQLDTHPVYARHPTGAVARLRLTVD